MDKWTRRRALADLRGYEEPERSAVARPLSEVVGEVLKELGLREQVDEMEVRAAWAEVVGEFLASHSQPHSLKGGVLYVSVLQPVVHYEIDRVWRPRILEKLRERFGKRMIREVRLRLG